MKADDLQKLKAHFPPDKVHWRVGATTSDKSKGMALAYIDARDVMERLDAICGPGGWQNRFRTEHVRVFCEIGILLGEDWIWKGDGAGDTDVEAEKGAISDAFKRAAVQWGVGRYLYDMPSPWVEIQQVGKSYKIKDAEKARLSRFAPGGRVETPSPQKAGPQASSAPPVGQKPLWWEAFAKRDVKGNLIYPQITAEMDFAAQLHDGFYKAAGEEIAPADYFEEEGKPIVGQITNPAEKETARAIYAYWEAAFAESEKLKEAQ